MEDKDLLMLAAYASGLQVKYQPEKDDFIHTNMNHVFYNKPWNPLKRDSDAFRLAVRLAMTVDTNGGCVYLPKDKYNPEIFMIKKQEKIGSYKSIRQAIVIAAAKIGKEKYDRLGQHNGQNITCTS